MEALWPAVRDSGRTIVIVPATVPLLTDTGEIICEVPAGFEIRVAYRGRPAQTYGPPERCYPAEDHEWEVDGVELDFGKWVPPLGKAEKYFYREEWCPCPDWLAPQLLKWAETEEGRQTIATYIQENG